MADAAHMMSDVAGFAVSLFAAWAVSCRSDNFSYSFGYHRAEIIGALLSIMVSALVMQSRCDKRCGCSTRNQPRMCELVC